MKRSVPRRKFIKTAGGAAFGAFFIPALPSVMQGCRQLNAEKTRIDWEELLSARDMIWDVLPGDMTEAPHFGNGLIGSMLWVEDNKIRLQVFRADVHDHGDHTYGWTAYSRPRYQIGYFTVQAKGAFSSCNLRQDIYNAELKGKITTSLGDIRIDHFVHKTDDLIYFDIRVDGDEELSAWEWHPFKAKPSRGGDPGSRNYGQAYAPYKELINPEHSISRDDELRIGLQDLALGGDYATAWKDIRINNKRSSLLVTIENSFPEKGSAKIAVDRIRETLPEIKNGFESWREKHRNWWHNYYPESYVSFPEPEGESFYWNNVYRLACCTRPGAKYIDTPGMWNSGGPWPYSTHDFNTQTAHFPVYTANRLHLGEALVNALKENKDTLINNVVPEEWQEDSALLPLATAFDLRGKRDGDGRYSEMLGCLPWLLNNVWLHYRYTMDKGILEDPLYPLLRRSINLYRHILSEGDDGRLHLPPTFSPELGNFSDCNFDLALLRWGCRRLIEICDVLNIDDPLKSEWENIIDKLVDYQADERGFKLGKERTAPEDHQHMSHLMMIYPLYLENIDNNEDISLLEKSLRNFNPPTALPKMAASQSSPAAASLGLGELAHERMNSILYSERENEKIGKNGIYYLATPCIETGLAFNTCVQDMLLQSWGGRIRVFPALPESWKDVEFHDLRAEGAFLVSAKMVCGITEWVKIKSLAGSPCIINPSIDGDIAVRSENNILLKKLENGFYNIDLAQGNEVTLI